MRRIRVGIDVGGTFTDAVAIDEADYSIIGQAKIPTTHAAKEGVAEGIITILQELLQENGIAPEEVVFIAHGTTQATNALLEGDVACVGILAMGSGFLAPRMASDSRVGDILLAKGRFLHTQHVFVETEDAAAAQAEIKEKLDGLRQQGAETIVATEAFGVDEPANEDQVVKLARQQGFYATSGHEVTKLYGLKVRTRTAVINASLIPRMMETANMTESCVKRSGIKADLMIMRCDGGVMTVDEVRRRPILTMLSGLAAGVAGALMYEKLSDGIFLEAGGTSTDISAVKNGQVVVRYGEVGGHKTYLSSLDVRTLGVAGGSMILVEHGHVADVGPRSAHIAGLPYEVFSPPLKEGRLQLVAPCADDLPQFASVVGSGGEQVALTLAGAANLLDKVPKEDYASGDKEAARLAWEALGEAIGLSAEAAAKEAMDIAASKVGRIVSSLIHDYELSPSVICLAGGGGSAGVIVPYLAEQMGYPWHVVKNAPIISTIGVALAMVRETVERTVASPGEEDIRSIRQEALERIMQSGAREETVEISLEIDKKANILRAVAMGATEMRPQASGAAALAELRQRAALSMGLAEEEVCECAAAGRWHVFEGSRQEKAAFFFQRRRRMVRVLDREGVIRLQKDALGLIEAVKENLPEWLDALLEEYTEYGTIGGSLPPLYVYYGEKQLDLSGLADRVQIDAVLDMELGSLPDKTQVIVIAARC